MRGSKKQKLRLEKQLRETRLRMDVLDNNSQRKSETTVTLDHFGTRGEDSGPEADKQKMEKFEIETENEEYSGYIYKVKNCNPTWKLLDGTEFISSGVPFCQTQCHCHISDMPERSVKMYKILRREIS